jgi:hypothetical protein
VAVVGDLLYGSTSPAPQNSDALFARDVESGDLRWIYRGKSIKNNTIVLSEGRLFFADNAATSLQRQEVLKAKIEELRARKKISVGMAEKELASADVRVAVALDAATGEKRWEKPVDLTDCGSNVLCAMAHQGVLLFCGAFGDGHYWPQFLANEYVLRRAVALSTEDGRLLWSKAIGYRIRPLIIGDTLYAEPWAFDLHTGEQKTRPHPLTGQLARWEFERPGHHCGPLSGSPNALFFRSASIAYYDLATDQGTYHFAGQRPGCWINTIPASGLVVIPEASSGCVCAFSIHCTVVLQPRPTNKAWGAFDAPGETLPVQHLAVNLGGPGDRKDDSGKVWFSFPRPWGRLRVNFSLAASTLPGGGYFSRAPEHCPVEGTDTPWLFASGCAGLRSCSVPLVGEADGAALYHVRLGFCDSENDRPGQRVFDIKLQGQTVAQNFDPLQAAGGPNRAVFQEFSGVEVGDKLTIELVPKVANPTKGQVPLLNTLEVTRLRTLHVGLAAPPSFLLSDLSRQQARPVKLANRTDAEFQGTLRLIAPAGFSVTPGETPVRLAPNEQRTLDVTAAVATPGQPGDYFLEVSLVRPDGTVESQRRARLEYLGPRGRLVIKAAEDAYMQAGGPETNRGHEASLLVDGGNQQMGDAAYSVTYLKFPASPFPPASASASPPPRRRRAAIPGTFTGWTSPGRSTRSPTPTARSPARRWPNWDRWAGTSGRSGRSTSTWPAKPNSVWPSNRRPSTAPPTTPARAAKRRNW